MRQTPAAKSYEGDHNMGLYKVWLRQAGRGTWTKTIRAHQGDVFMMKLSGHITGYKRLGELAEVAA